MRLLLIAYYFPPCGGAAALRALHWAKYLPQHGLDLTVIAPEDGVYPMQDGTLLGSIPAGVAVHRVRGFTPSAHPALRRVRGGSFSEGGVAHDGLLRRALRGVRDLFFVPDEFVGFVPAAVRRALELHAERPFDVVLTLSHPLSVHLAGLELKRRLGIPWATEFGDPWTENWQASGRSLSRKVLEPRMERSVLTECCLAVATTEGLRDRWRSRFPQLDPERFQAVPIGYDEAGFAGLQPERHDRWTLGYAGALYHDRRADSFLEGLGRYLERQPAEREAIRVVFIGAKDEPNKRSFREAVERHRLEGVVEDLGFRSHREALAMLIGSDALLYVGGLPPEGDLTVQSKVYEYLRAWKPVLAISREVEALRILRRGPGVFRADQGDPQGACLAIAQIRAATPRQNLPAAARDYEVAALAGRLAGYLRRHAVPSEARP